MRDGFIVGEGFSILGGGFMTGDGNPTMGDVFDMGFWLSTIEGYAYWLY